MSLDAHSRGTKHKMFAIGVDGGTFDIILPLVEKGDLPNFERMLKEGAGSDLESTAPPFSGPAWASFQTRKAPSNHGIFDFINKKANSMNKEEDHKPWEEIIRSAKEFGSYSRG